MDDATATDGDPAVTGDGDSGGRPAGDDPPDGLVSVRGAIYGVGLVWLTAMAAFGALQAAVYGVTTSAPYLLLAVGGAALSVAAGYGALGAFGLR